MKKIAVLVSGGGTNLQAIIDGIQNKKITNTQIAVVISNNKNAYALERAKKNGIEICCISPKDFPNREAFNDSLLEAVDRYRVDFVVLAGFLVILPSEMIKKYAGRIINIHPSLIPSFCGKGFYGLKVHEGVLERGCRITGATVHFVDEGTDTGPIILQKAVEVKEEDTPESLQKRVMEEAEWEILPEAVNLIANERLEVIGNMVRRKETGGKENMKVLIVGGGGREHAITWKVKQSKRVDQIYCVPGNAGIAEIAECVNIGEMELEQLADFAQEKQVDLTIIGMDAPLVAGIVDKLEERGLRVFGPRKNAAIIEGSKVFSKGLMKKYGIPTAEYEVFTDAEEALHYLKTADFPIVLKADGLALGKGALICESYEEAVSGVRAIMLERQFGEAGKQIVIEEFLNGREVSVLAFCDGSTILPMTSAQDHKRAKDGDKGLNTGGMGTFSPSPFYTKELDDYCKKFIYQPTIDAMKAEGRDFVGILFVGLILTEKGPKVLEYNARFGDPETQVVLPRMKNDIIEVMEACIDGRLEQVKLEFEENAAVCVVLASDGYPEKYEKGFPIRGLDTFRDKEGYYVFHAGTKKTERGVVTNGGRILGVTAKGNTLKEARKNAYQATEWIEFENKYLRSDIGKAIEEI